MNIDAQISQIIKRLDGISDMSLTLERTLHRIGMLLELKIKENIRSKGMVDEGALINSIKYRVEMSEGGGRVIMLSEGVRYAGILEYGGTIRPKNAKALAIPLTPWAKKMRKKYPGVGNGGPTLREAPLRYAKATIQGLRRGVLVDAKDRIGFILADSVKIPEKAYMREAIYGNVSVIMDILRSIGSSGGK